MFVYYRTIIKSKLKMLKSKVVCNAVESIFEKF